ncbi:MAG: hypothetical protein QXX51_08180 [Candidatus Bathyarchaeia archaeon]
MQFFKLVLEMMSLRVLLLSSSVIVTLIVCFFLGTAILIYPSTFILCFLGMFLALLIGAEIQTAANPGIEEMDEPDFWFSEVYDVWLYVTDREGWAYLASFLAGIFSLVIGSLSGWILCNHWNVSGISFISWLVGVFLLLSLAIFTATSGYWQKSQ